MAYEVETVSETYVDTPLSVFPTSLDNIEHMSDLTAINMHLEKQYYTYWDSGNYALCVQLLNDNPDFAKSFMSADRYNILVDAINAMQQYLLNQIADVIEATVQSTVGINDNPTAEEASLCAYSAEKIDKMHNMRQITLPASGWSDTYPYTQTIEVDGVLETDTIKVVGVYHADGNTYEQDKALDKAASLLMYVGDGVVDGAITFKAKKLPEVDFTIITEGG